VRRLVQARVLGAGLALGGLLSGVLASGAGPTWAAASEQQVEVVSLAPPRVATAGQSRCGASLSPLGANCVSFDGRDVRSLPDLWVVGYENNGTLGNKHMLQTVAVFPLAQLRGLPPRATVSRAVLRYAEASTVRRSPGGDSEYGILPTCNSALGVPASGWNGAVDRVVPTQPAAVGGVQGATTGDYGAWDVTPHVQQWLASGGNDGVLVLRADDESLDVRGMTMCLSYVFDLGLTVEVTVPQG
jgi:hypothetical protein